MLNTVVKSLIRFVPGLVATVFTFVSLFFADPAYLQKDIADQIERVTALESAYAAGKIEPVDESSFFFGDLQAELDAGMKFNELSFIATHNSYQTEATRETKLLYKALSDATFGLISAETGNFASETLTDQLNCGIRSFEIDIETFDRDGEISFTCMHSPYIEMSTSCFDFALAMKEIAMWSDNNPDHLPITIIIEPKSLFIPLVDMRFFNMDYAQVLDETLRETLGDKLFTPADMLGEYPSFAQMRADDGWCEVKDMLGKVLVLLHDSGVTEEYIAADPSIRSQAMFPMLRPKDIDRDCASFIIYNDPKKVLENKAEMITEGRAIIRTMADSYTSVSQEELEQAFASGAQIISTDHPIKTSSQQGDYYVTFGEKTTARKTS